MNVIYYYRHIPLPRADFALRLEDKLYIDLVLFLMGLLLVLYLGQVEFQTPDTFVGQ